MGGMSIVTEGGDGESLLIALASSMDFNFIVPDLMRCVCSFSLF